MSSNFDLFKGLLRMMEIRGYDTSYYNFSPDITSDTFDTIIIPWLIEHPTSVRRFLIEKGKNTSRYMLSSTFEHLTRPGDRCIIFFTELGSAKTVPLSETCTFGELYLNERSDPFEGGVTTGIIVSSVKLSNNAQQRLTEFKNVDPNIFLQHFLDIDILYNPNESIWGSTFTAFSLEESAKFLVENGLTRNQLPLIDISYPICKYNGIRPDQILEFDRHTFIPDVTVHNEIHYRLTIERTH